MSQNETNNVYLWARATKEFQKSLNDFGLALEIIQNNDNIPLILTGWDLKRPLIDPMCVEQFYKCFDKIYYSSRMGKRKPGAFGVGPSQWVYY